MEPIHIAYIHFHIGWCVLIFIHTRKTGFLKPQRYRIHNWRPCFLVKRSGCIARVVCVKGAAFGWQLADNFWKNKYGSKINLNA